MTTSRTHRLTPARIKNLILDYSDLKQLQARMRRDIKAVSQTEGAAKKIEIIIHEYLRRVELGLTPTYFDYINQKQEGPNR